MKVAAKSALTIILLGIIIWYMGGLQAVLNILAGMKVTYILLVLTVHTLDRSLMTYKWLRLLRSKNIFIPFFKGLKIYCASMIWGMFMPSTIGADAIRIISTSRKGHDAKEILASVIIERLAGFLSALLLGILSFILISNLTELNPQFDLVLWFGCLMLIIGLISFVMSFNQKVFNFIHDKILRRFHTSKIVQKLKQFHLNYSAYQDEKNEMITFFGLTFCEQILPIIISWLIARGLGVDVGLLFVAGALPLTMLVSRLPISINGIGVFEATFALLMSLTGVSTVEAVAIAFSGRILKTVAYLPWWMAEVFENRSFQLPISVVEGS